MSALQLKELNKIFNPGSIAVIGASNKKGSVGYTLFNNLIGAGYEGVVYPVNKSAPSVQGIHSYRSVDQIPRKIDLALIAVPAKTVPEVMCECGESGIRGAIIISAGFKEIGAKGKELEDEVLDIARDYDIRFIGPNCLGIIRPKIHLNASFAPLMPDDGKIAFISQSGALCAAVLDWCHHRGIGFSSFVSVGSMADITFGDLIDYFGMDPDTGAIILYIEALKNVRGFMSAARHFAKTKPIIVVKSGRCERSAAVATSHTGAMAGDDDLYDAAFKRAGIVRVTRIEELFDCAEALDSQTRPTGNHLAIVTNAGGPGVMAADELLSQGGELAELSNKTIEALNACLPPYWSHGNPVDILGDATPERYRDATSITLRDPNVDGVLLLLTPVSMSDSELTARYIVDLNRDISPGDVFKPLLASWMGEALVEKGRKILESGGIPSFETPESAVTTYLHMYQYTKNIASLYEMPEDILTGFHPAKDEVKSIFRTLAKDGRELLTIYESMKVLAAYDIPTVKTMLAHDPEEAIKIADEIGYPVAMKIVSPQITHKTDIGCVKLNIQTQEGVRTAFEEINRNAGEHDPDATIHGVAIQSMVTGTGYEVIIGSKRDKLFGPAILFGAGGTMVEYIRDQTIGFPPLNQALAHRMIEDTRISKILKNGFRGSPPANIRLIEEALVKISFMLIDFPEIEEMDINPIHVNDTSLLALDARILINPGKVNISEPPGSDLIISRCPTKYNQEWTSPAGDKIFFRAVRPEDEPLWLEMVRSFSDETIRQRFFAPLSEIDHHMVVRYCHIDYDREIAIAAFVEGEEGYRMVGVGRVVILSDENTGEFGMAIRDEYQERGIGNKLVDIMIEIARDFRLRTIIGDVLADNYRMLKIAEDKGFKIKRHEDPSLRRVVLNL
ncbi:acetyl CoA synthetase subunit alpha [Methanosarcinales archaeon]|nr:MAG: acetyl CoA synthetase subunit alpha [Methanosarcinales archaeon]